MAYDQKKKKTRKERFLGEMNEVLPWDVLLAPILEHYPKAGKGRRPIGAEVMLRIYFMQQWYALSDPAMEGQSLRRGIDAPLRGGGSERGAGRDDDLQVPPSSGGAQADRSAVRAGQGLSVGSGPDRERRQHRGRHDHPRVVVSTKNKEGKRDPEMASTKKGNTFHFGMKGPRGQRHEGPGAQRGDHGCLGA